MSTQTRPGLGFGPPLIGQTERALDAILVRELEGSDVSPTGWVLLRSASAAGGRLGRQELTERAGVLAKLSPEEVELELGKLTWSELIARDGEEVVVTAAGQALQERVQSAVGGVIGRLWGDLPEADLDATARVLETVLSRANAELGYSI